MPNVVTAPSDRSFGSIFVVVFAIIALWQGRVGNSNAAIVSASLSLLTFVVRVTRSVLLNPLNRAWMKFGALLHAILNPIVLGAMYYLVITPFGVAMRLCGRDVLKRRLDHTTKSYWIRRDPHGPPPRFASPPILRLHAIPQRVFPVSQSPQEILAIAHHCRVAAIGWTAHPGPGFARSPFHLHAFLNATE
jgi:hypothetical protein